MLPYDAVVVGNLPLFVPNLSLPILPTENHLRMTSSRLRGLVIALIVALSSRRTFGGFSTRHWIILLSSLSSSLSSSSVASLFLAGIAGRTVSGGGCSTVYLAKSSIPGAGWGVFAARDYDVGELIVSLISYEESGSGWDRLSIFHRDTRRLTSSLCMEWYFIFYC
jgi:hypothetical protein